MNTSPNMSRIFISLAAALVCAPGAHSQGTVGLAEIVQIENGTLRGMPRNSQGVLAFFGIPRFLSVRCWATSGRKPHHG